MGVCVSQDEQFDYDAELHRDHVSRSVIVDDDGDDDMKDVGPIYRHKDWAEGPLADAPFDGETEEERCRTIWFGFKHGVKNYGNAKCLGTRRYNADGTRGEYLWESYRDVHESVLAIGSALVDMGIKKGDIVGVCSANRAEWVITALACYSHGFVVVALYDTLGEDAIKYISNHAEIKIAFVSKKKLSMVVEVMDQIPTLETIVQFDVQQLYGNEHESVDEEVKKAGEEYKIDVVGFSHLLVRGREANNPASPPEAADLAFIMYTSGTTGTPKGVMLRHGNLMACIGGAMRSSFTLEPEKEIHISYLPLAHIFETIIEVGMFCNGGGVGFFSGSPKTLINDIQLLKPTIFCGVPRVFSRIYDKVMAGVNAPGGLMQMIKRVVVTRALQKQSYIARRGELTDDDGTMQKIRAKLGLTNCNLIVTGAAPCPPYLMEFLRVVIKPSKGVLQGYGLSETSAAVSITSGHDHTMGHVGTPLPSAEIRLQSVPEMGYLAEDGCGEVLMRGPSIFLGYYKMEEKTADALENGWLHSGDIGRWNENGTLSIIDRKKNIFKMSQGEYIAAEKIEAVYKRSPLVNQVWVYGNSYKPFVVCVVVPEVDAVVALLKGEGMWTVSDDLQVGSVEWRRAYKECCEEHAHNEVIHDAVKESLRVKAVELKLKRFEMVRDVHCEFELDELLLGFNVGNDCMTPTFKLRRPFLLKQYRDQLIGMYTKYGEPPKPSERWV